MLTKIKERATGWIAWAIVILITIPFALWGVNSYFSQGAEVNVAEFDGEAIDYQTYQRALYNERDRLRGVYGQNAEMLSGGVLGMLVVDSLVNETLLARDAREHGYRVSDQQLVETIRNHPAFQSDNRFDRDRYERILMSSGLSIADFEGLQRQSAVLQQIQTGFRESVFTMDSEVDAVLSILLQDRIGEFALVNPSTFISRIEVSDADIQDEYETNRSQYVEDEKVKIEYIHLSRDNFAKNFMPSDDTLRELYESEADRYRVTEQRNISHILLDGQGDGNMDAADFASSLASRLRSGEEFGSLAKEYSADVGSSENDGNLGWFGRGEMPSPEFEAAAFSLGENEISDPVVSEFGTHILRVNEIRGETVKPFEEVRSDLALQATRAQADAEMFEISEQLRNLAYEQPENLEHAANALNLEVLSSTWFSRAIGTGIAQNDRIRDAAFSEEVLGQGFNSDLIEIENNEQVVLRVVDHEESRQLSMADVRDEVSEKLLVSKSQERAKNLAEEVVQELKLGADWNSILADNGLESLALPTRIDTATGLSAVGVALVAFSAQKPQAGRETYGSGPLADGSYSIFRVTEVQNGNPSTATEEQRQDVVTALQNRFGDEMFDSYLVLLRDGIDIDINEELL